jgi:hypothetical protein
MDDLQNATATVPAPEAPKTISVSADEFEALRKTISELQSRNAFLETRKDKRGGKGNGQAPPPLTIKLSKNDLPGRFSIYGAAKFPLNFTPVSWARVMEAAPRVNAFIAEHDLEAKYAGDKAKAKATK